MDFEQSVYKRLKNSFVECKLQPDPQTYLENSEKEIVNILGFPDDYDQPSIYFSTEDKFYIEWPNMEFFASFNKSGPK